MAIGRTFSKIYKIKNTILPSVDSVKDLGVMVDHHLKFDIHILSCS